MDNNNKFDKIKYNREYSEKHYKRFTMYALPEVYEDIKKSAENAEKSVTKYLVDLHLKYKDNI